MPYSAEISRQQPTAILLLLDQSASMQEPFGGAEKTGDAAPSRARVLADTVNDLLQNLVLRCAKEEGVRDYFHVGVIGYGQRVQRLVQPTEEYDPGTGLVPISHLADRPQRMEQRVKEVDDGDGGTTETRVKTPIWFDPQAKNGTPMCQALDLAAQSVRDWIDQHPHSFPPIVLNVTDGEATDGDPLRYAQELRSFATDDGEVLLFNIHLSASEEAPAELPSTTDEVPKDDEYAEVLFQMSSRLPFSMRSAAEQEGYSVTLDTRGFVFNADPVSLVTFLEIGTRPSNLR
ncbi:vWA domain-containing protein [Salinibacter grassmerensis]|uniref:vWA domain-containing protein n=1 Tax=Salinibacter grassmerensis TaxID=3040353 RepID=UPI0021E8F5C6|nr:vWA domain-containing protein [Salinibacter grassmerensis]